MLPKHETLASIPKAAVGLSQLPPWQQRLLWATCLQAGTAGLPFFQKNLKGG